RRWDVSWGAVVGKGVAARRDDSISQFQPILTGIKCLQEIRDIKPGSVLFNPIIENSCVSRRIRVLRSQRLEFIANFLKVLRNKCDLGTLIPKKFGMFRLVLVCACGLLP